VIKVTDWIAEYLVRQGIRHVFMITGGGAMHLNDSLGKCAGLEFVCFHHEQAVAMAAEAYARQTGRIAAVCVTTGPGGINALGGVYCAYTDSIPMLVISGQVRFDTTVRGSGLNLRQLGDQEWDIVRTAATMTKYAAMVTDPSTIRYHLERAHWLAYAGRPGPCWIDIPMNVQGARIEEADLAGYDPAEDSAEVPPPVAPKLAEEILDRIVAAERPVLFVGPAVRSSGAFAEFRELVERLNVPVVTAFNAHDCLQSDHRLYVGRPGTIGDRAGNFVVQNSDLLLVLGCRLNIRQIGYNWGSFARAAYKIVVDIDPLELKKPTIRPDLPVHADVADLMRQMLAALGKRSLPIKESWLAWCRTRYHRYPAVLPKHAQHEHLVNPYYFIQRLGEQLADHDIIICANATACITPFQALRMKRGQRMFSNSGSAPMGYDLPAAIGASFGAGRGRVVCLAGDGSIQMNLQELQTICHHALPLKIFVLNNQGYHSIRQTQSNFFGPPLVGCDGPSGVSFPDMRKIAAAYGIPFTRCETHGEVDGSIAQTLAADGPAMCEVMLTPEQGFEPKASSKRLPDGRMVSKPLEDLFPFLDRAEFLQNMIIPPLPDYDQ
jgi:acetolactate synthase-1/2/3 large subunit